MFLTKLIYFALTPLGTSLVGILLAILLLKKNKHKWATRLLVASTLWVVTWSLPAVSYSMRWAMESAFENKSADALPTADFIVVLGGGVDGPVVRGGMPDLRDAADRVWFGAQLYKAGKASTIVLSGGATGGGNYMTEAAAMGRVLADFGVPASAILLEDKSRTTRENAEYVLQLLRAKGAKKILLVTSALHMKRSLKNFQNKDIELIAAPCDFEGRLVFQASDFIPSAYALNGSGRAIKELMGQLFY